MYKLLSKCTLLASALLLRFLLGVRHVKWLHPILNTTVTHRTEHNTHRTHTRTRVGRSMARVRPCAFILPVARGKENKKKKKKTVIKQKTSRHTGRWEEKSEYGTPTTETGCPLRKNRHTLCKSSNERTQGWGSRLASMHQPEMTRPPASTSGHETW